MKIFSKLLLLLLIGGLLQNCVQAPKYPLIPKIEFRSFSADTINQEDFVNLTIYFEDGDGDFGKAGSNIDTACNNLCAPEEVDTSCFNNRNFNAFLIDNRTGCLISSGLIIPDIPNKGSTNAISGEMTISIGPICCFDGISGGCITLPNLPVDALMMDVKIRDKAGNFSNTITVGPVKILCN